MFILKVIGSWIWNHKRLFTEVIVLLILVCIILYQHACIQFLQ